MSFSQEASKTLKGIPCHPSKICKSLLEHLILPSVLPGCFSLPSSKLYSRTCQYPIKEHLILSVGSNFALSRTPQFPRRKHTSEHLFYRTDPSSSFQISVIFSWKGKAETIFHTSSSLICSKSCSCITIKILFIHNTEKTNPIFFPTFLIWSTKNTLSFYLCTFMFTFSSKFLRTSLIIKGLIKHEKKFNSKVFHDT